ncbi:MAG: DEAD/DEAH box helicase [Verrucomicrobiota bacterium]|nr:DEAD/DEAH box helicase [Verrucomicrobiota bacterium]
MPGRTLKKIGVKLLRMAGFRSKPAPHQEAFESSRGAHDGQPPRHSSHKAGGHGHRFERQYPPRPRGTADSRLPPHPRPAPLDGQAKPEKAPSPRGEPWMPAQFHVPPAGGRTRFHDLDLPVEIMRAIADLGFQYCLPIQTKIIPKIIEGADVAGRSQTGTGKTAAFLIGSFTRFIRRPTQGHRRAGAPRMLVLAPTRELVLQIEKEARALSKYASFDVLAVFGGMDYKKQRERLIQGPVDLVVATPGRLLDYLRQGCMDLRRVEVLVIDEADRMLDMGFIPDVRSIVYSTPPKARRQTLFFSATLTADVIRLSASWTKDPVTISVEPRQVAAKTIDQVVYIAAVRDKFTLLYNILAQNPGEQILVFGNRRDVTDRLARRLRDHGINCALLSGDVPQNARLRRLDDFKTGRIRVLVATDVAGRGIHVEGISHVINYNLPDDPEDYVHRIGRTGRVGAKGTSVSFACEGDSFLIASIEKYLGHDLKAIHPDESLLQPAPPSAYRHADHPRDAARSSRRYQDNGGARHYDSRRRGGRRHSL